MSRLLLSLPLSLLLPGAVDKKRKLHFSQVLPSPLIPLDRDKITSSLVFQFYDAGKLVFVPVTPDI